MRIPIASDHAGYELKEKVKGWLVELGQEPVDLGCPSPDPVDYPDYGVLVAQAVHQGQYEKGILICGTGIGMSMVANRFSAVRAALCHDLFTTQASREHNDANVLVMGARVIQPELAQEMVKLWLSTPFQGGRHAGRLAKMDQVAAIARQS